MGFFYWGRNSPNSPLNRASAKSNPGHGFTRDFVANHEGGHYVTGIAQGVKMRKATISGSGNNHSGWTYYDNATWRAHAVTIAAGTEATNMIYGLSEATSNGDAALLREACRQHNKEFPDDKITPAQMIREARSEVRRHRGDIISAGRRLNKRGRI
jgi:hypothetical protein